MPVSLLLSSLMLVACADKGPLGPQRCTIEEPDPGALHTDGTTVRDELGRIVLLRGVNAGGRSKFPPYMPFDYPADDFAGSLDAYLDVAQSWGVNVLRVPFSWAALEPTRGQWDLEWLARYDALLDGAAARDLWTIVDFHQDIYGEFYCGDGFPRWTVLNPPADHHDCPSWFTAYLSDDDVAAAFDQLWADTPVAPGEVGNRTALIEMWRAKAAHHAGRAGVIGYEILNEPFRGTADSATWGAETLPAFYSEAGRAIRDEAPESLLFFDSTGLDAVAATTTIAPPEGEDWVFAPHWYDAAVLAGVDNLSADPDAGLGAWAAQGAEWDMPVLIGEFGVGAELGIATDYANAMWEALDRYQLSGTWWEYSASAERWNDEALSLAGADGAPYPTTAGPLARPTPRLIAGEAPTWSLVEGVFSLSFEAVAGGVTEVRLPTSDPAWARAAVEARGGCVDLAADRVLFRADRAGAAELTLSR